jgi:Type I phosphodiesterase / nucleotide pyrophosphatase
MVPRYDGGSLAGLAMSVLASLAVPGEPNPLGLPPADRVCVLLVDGLGWTLLRDHQAAAPFLSELATTAAPLTAGFPATTATSLGSFGTGQPPGQHGLLGYQVAIPGAGMLLNALRWDPGVDPLAWQPSPTIFDRAAAAGVSCVRAGPAAFAESGLSRAAMRGAGYRAADSIGALVWHAAAAAAASPRSLTFAYFGDLDTTGHRLGCTSEAWQYELAHVDRLAEQLAGALPRGTVLYITADHGMTDVPAADRIDADALSELRDGVALLGGEPRARHVYAVPGAAADVLAAWTELLSGRAWVAGRDQAIADGWFGQVRVTMADRIGDVVAAPCGSGAIVATRTEPRESALVGMHGSLTADDQLVPLLVAS